MGYPNMSKQGSMFSHLSVKNAITFSTIWTVFYRKQDGLHVQSPESQLYIVTHDSWSTKKKIGFSASEFFGYRWQRAFQEKFNSIF